MLKVKFKDAPIGARFRYPGSDSDQVWVKLNSYPTGDGLIVAWNGNEPGYQSHCCFVDEIRGIDFNTEVELI